MVWLSTEEGSVPALPDVPVYLVRGTQSLYFHECLTGLRPNSNA